MRSCGAEPALIHLIEFVPRTSREVISVQGSIVSREASLRTDGRLLFAPCGGSCFVCTCWSPQPVAGCGATSQGYICGLHESWRGIPWRMPKWVAHINFAPKMSNNRLHLALHMTKVCHVLLCCSSALVSMGVPYGCLANHILRCNIAIAKWFGSSLGPTRSPLEPKMRGKRRGLGVG